MVRKYKGLLAVFVMCGICMLAVAARADDMMRMITPVRLPSEPGPDLESAVTETRQILDRFREGGFNHAIWAVSELPKEDKDMKDWVKACLKAFPTRPILALDVKLENAGSSLDSDKLRSFLDRALRKVDSVMINYTELNNYENVEDSSAAIEIARSNAELIRNISKKTFLWLLIDDDSKAVERIPEWTGAIGDLVDGYYMHRGHGLNVLKDESFAKAGRPLLSTGKPVVRGGFAYVCPRVRPGIENDLRDQYEQRLDRYEKWIVDDGYAGYSRLIGESIPADVNINMNFLVALNAKKNSKR